MDVEVEVEFKDAIKGLSGLMTDLKLIMVMEELPEDMMYQASMDVQGEGTNKCADWLEYIRIGKGA